MRWSPSLILLSMGLVACGEAEVLSPDLPQGCDVPRACQVEGIDLVVDSPRLLLDEGHLRDDLTGRAVLMPGEPFSFVVAVWNRGSVSSEPTSLTGPGIDAAVPALAPGQTFADTLETAAPTYLAFWSNSVVLRAGTAALQAGEDPLHANDSNESEPYIVALPVIHADLMFPDSVTAEQPFTATVTLHNTSRYGAFEPSRMAFCLFDFDVGCGSWSGAPFGLTDVPAVAPDDSWTTELEVTIPLHEDYETWDWLLVACIANANPAATLDDFGVAGGARCVAGNTPIHVREPVATGGGAS